MPRKRKSRARWAQLNNYDYEDFVQMSREELILNLRSAAREAQRRVSALKREDLESYSNAYQNLLLGGRLGSGPVTYGKSVTSRSTSGIRKEIVRLRAFLNASTSTVAGARERESWYNERFPGLDRDQLKTFWERYYEIMNDPRSAGFFNALGSERVQRIVYNRYMQNESAFEAGTNRNFATILNRMQREYERGETSASMMKEGTSTYGKTKKGGRRSGR